MNKQFHELALISVPDLARFDPANSDRTLLLAQAVAECFTELGLCKTNLAARFHEGPQVFEVLLGDLTEEGLVFARAGFQRWLGDTDGWKSGAALAKFKSTLTKQWEKSRANAL